MRTLLLAPLLVPIWAQAQPEYLAHQPVWVQSSVCANQSGAGPCLAQDAYRYTLGSDSLIGGVTYTRILRSGAVTLMPMGGQPDPSCTGTTAYSPWLAALVRQQGRSLRAWTGEVDTLLHDFDLEVGAMLPLSLTNHSSDVQVVAKDSVQMNGEWRRVYTLSNSWAEFLVEGAGSNFGLLEPIANFLECGYSLECYGLAGEGYYPVPGVQCDLSDGLAEAAAPLVTMGPNPAGEQLTIRLSAAVANATLTLLDATGRAVRSTPMMGSTHQWDVADLPAGVFHVVLRTPASVTTRAVVVMH